MKKKHSQNNITFFSSTNEVLIDDLFYCIKYISPEKLINSKTEERVKEKILTKNLYSSTDDIIKDDEFGELIEFVGDGDIQRSWTSRKKHEGSPITEDDYSISKSVNFVEKAIYVVSRKPLKNPSLRIQTLFFKHYDEYFKELFELKKGDLFVEKLFENNSYYIPGEKKFNILYGFLNSIELEDIIIDDVWKAVKNVCHRLICFFPKDEISKVLIKDYLKDDNYKNF